MPYQRRCGNIKRRTTLRFHLSVDNTVQAFNDDQGRPLTSIHASAQEQPFGLRDYLAVLWARKWIIVLITALAIGSAFLYTSRQTHTYQTTATVRVLASGSDESATSEFLNMQTERELAVSALVAKHASDRLDERTSADVLLAGLVVEVVPETEILRFTYVSAGSKVAQDRANAFASGYLDYRR